MSLSTPDIQEPIEDIKPTSKPRRSFWRSVFKWTILACLFLLLLALIAAAYIWQNRYRFIEKIAVDTLAEQGIDGELTLQSLDKTKVGIGPVKLSENGIIFFEAEHISAEYDWRDMLGGQAKRLVFTKPKARITLDKTGKIIDGWLPPRQSGQDSAVPSLPPQGIEIKEAELTLITPLGTAISTLNGQYFTHDNFTLSANISPSKLSTSDWTLNGGGQVKIALQGARPDIKMDLSISTLEHPAIDATAISITGDMVPVLNGSQLRMSGETHISFDSLLTAQIQTGQGQISWLGDMSHDKDKTQPLSFKGTWDTDITDLSIPDPLRRNSLAKTLSLAAPLSEAPIAQNFAPDLTRNLEQLLEKSRFKGRGEAVLSPSGFTAHLSNPVTLTSAQTTLTLKPSNHAPLYTFNPSAKDITLAFHADMSRPAGFTLNNALMKARAQTAWQFGAIEHFSADIRTSQDWRGRGLNDTPARLSPVQAKAVYNGGVRRSLTLSGDINFDGPLPGAVVSQLIAGGDLSLDFMEGGSVMYFRPAGNAPITISRIETDTGWHAENFTGQLLVQDTVNPAPLLRRMPRSTQVQAQLSDISFTARDTLAERNLDLNFESLAVSGELIGKSQNWNFDTQNIHVTSEDTPGPGTDIDMPQMAIEIWREPNQDLRFQMNAPAANAKTQLVNASNLAVKAHGTPANFELDYSPGQKQGDREVGRVKFIGDALPPLPLTGLVSYKDDAFSGEATTFLPFGDETPIDVTYNFKDGAGTAFVDIPELRFTPDGLQPQNFVKTLKGKIAEVEGLVSAQINLAFAAGQPLQSTGTAQLKSLNFGTLPGPLSGVNTQLSFSSFFPLQSQGRQTLTVDKFDPGLPLENGVIEFELIPDGVKLYSAQWPMGTGSVGLEPFDWLYSAAENRVVMRLDKVSIGEFLNGVGNGSLEATGDIEGRLPIVLAGVNVKVDDGELNVKNGGTIRYKSEQTHAAGERNEYAKMAFEALEDFNYRSLSAKIDGPLDGAIEVGMEFDGSNKDVLNNQPFRFGINIEGELLNILRSFNTNDQIKAELARRQLDRESLPPELE